MLPVSSLENRVCSATISQNISIKILKELREDMLTHMFVLQSMREWLL